ncbi:MAG: hypothetical protein KJ061_19245 [Vicinamibacteraceae bacterium]|nr:hypothetical protein [Vicinamibacteraceae bacterium]
MRPLIDPCRTISLLVLLVAASPLPRPGAGSAQAATLTPEAIEGWQRYVAATEHRRAAELGGGSGFLVLDRGAAAAAERAALLRGEIVVRPMTTTLAGGAAVPVRSALVHHWRGAVFLPGTTVARVMASLETEPPSQADVLRKQVLSRAPNAMTVALRLRRTRIVTVVYDTEHDVRFERLGPGRAASTTRATKIVELRDPGTSRERALPPGRDRGFLWRLHAWWRYEQVAGGVIAECESVSLSRDVPFGLRTVTAPLINGAARDAMQSALEALRGI